MVNRFGIWISAGVEKLGKINKTIKQERKPENKRGKKKKNKTKILYWCCNLLCCSTNPLRKSLTERKMQHE